MYLPEVIILSTQRSGTHLLESFLVKHPMFHGKGEMFLRYTRSGVLLENVEGKINIGILMYSELPIFFALGGSNYNPKVIHLLRDPYKVALSRLQMEADKSQLGSAYRAHYFIDELSNPEVKKILDERISPDLTRVESLAASIAESQQKHIRLLESIAHLQISYEEIVKDDESVHVLDKEIQRRLLSFLDVPADNTDWHTHFYKTDIAQ